jgi:hypothetical protein
MPKPRGTSHTTLTETAQQVVHIIKKLPGIKMIAPGVITTNSKRGGQRFVTVIETASGCELLISGQSVQRVAVHTDDISSLYQTLQHAKPLRHFTFSKRARFPGQ